MTATLQLLSKPAQRMIAQEAKRELARRSMLAFTQYTFPAYEANWHHIAVCHKVEDLVRGRIKRLILTMPPRHGKSELISRRLPAFAFGLNPNTQIIATSYAADLSSKMNRDVQRIMTSKEYHELFPQSQLFAKNVRMDAREMYLRNSDTFEIVGHRGTYVNAGVGGAITGMGMNIGIVDDPFKNREEANSPVIRQKVWDWYTSTFRTRAEKDASILIVMTRWHEDDLVGRLLMQQDKDPNAEKWELVNFPAIYDGTSLGAHDPRTTGEALWPTKYNIESLMATKASVGTYDWNALYQQSPRPLDGGLFRRAWFKDVHAIPARRVSCRYWDMASTEKFGSNDPDWTVGAKITIDLDQRTVVIEDIVRGRWSPKDCHAVVRQTANTDGTNVFIAMEQESGASGKANIDFYTRHVLQGFAFYGIRSDSAKAVRATPLAAQCEAGNVYLYYAPNKAATWQPAMIEEFEGFPNATHDDQVDAVAGAFNFLVCQTQRTQTIVYEEPYTIGGYWG